MKTILNAVIFLLFTLNVASQTMTISLKNGKKVDYSLSDIEKITYSNNSNSFVDSRDGKEYKIIRIGNQIWMAENLNFETNGSYCYETRYSNCDVFGKLYTWNTAQNVCPTGWHLPSDSEWQTMIDYLGGNINAINKLKSSGSEYWGLSNSGNNSSGFHALPGGYFTNAGRYSYIMIDGIWWTSSSYSNNSDRAWYRAIGQSYSNLQAGHDQKNIAASVRCVKNN